MTRKRRLTGEAALEAAYSSVDTGALCAAWGVDLPDDMLRLALTHRSFSNENGGLPNNERLEFLGDAVLGFVVAERLYLDNPERNESEVSKMRASVVNMYSLAAVAREMSLGPAILLGRGEKLTAGSDKDSILADTFEALLGATYLVHGVDVSRERVLAHLGRRIATATTSGFIMDWKTLLLETLSQHKLPQPEYVTTSSGPEHALVFRSELTIPGSGEETSLVTVGTGKSKKIAEHHAAERAVRALHASYGPLSGKSTGASEGAPDLNA